MKSNVIRHLEVLLDEWRETEFPTEKVVHVADVCFGAGPGGGDYRCYELEQCGSGGDTWTLWSSILDEWTSAFDEWNEKTQEAECDEELEQPRLYVLQARSTSDKRATARDIAYEMLKACWAKEPSVWGTDLSLLSVDQPGILSKNDIMKIKKGLS